MLIINFRVENMWKKVFKFIFFILILIGLETQAFAEIDTSCFNQYIKELETKAKANWDAPARKYSYDVVVQFKIDKSGDIKQCSIFKTSGDKFIDAIAIDTIEKLKPYKLLPSEFKGNSIDVRLTFNYNVFKLGIIPPNKCKIEQIDGKQISKNLSRQNNIIYKQYLKDVKKELKINIPQEHFSKKITLEIDFVIQNNGIIKNITIIKSSNNHLYDTFVTEAIKKTNLSNIPVEIGIRELKVKYIINSGTVINLGNSRWYLPYPF